MTASLILGCRLDYGSDIELDAMARDLPDVALSEASFGIYRNGLLVMDLQSEKSEFRSRAGVRDFRMIRFRQYDEEGKEVARGRSDAAQYRIQEETVRFSGGLQVDILSEGISIHTEELEWDKKSGTLSGGADIPVTVIRTDGTVISGRNLHADLHRHSLDLGGGVEGVVVSGE